MLHTYSAIVRDIIEYISIIIIMSGVLMASIRLVKLIIRSHRGECGEDSDSLIRLRLSFEGTLMLGLQFLMAADIIGTISNPDLKGVVVLSVIVLLRVILSFTLSKEVAEMDRQKRESEERKLLSENGASGNNI